MYKKIFLVMTILTLTIFVMTGCGNMNFHGSLTGHITANYLNGEREEINVVELDVVHIESDQKLPSSEIDISFNEDKTKVTYYFNTFSLGTGTYKVQRVLVESTTGKTYEMFPNFEVYLEENQSKEENFNLYYNDHYVK